MRIARILKPDVGRALIALERDGALYDVEALEHRAASSRDPGRLVAAGDFQARVACLRTAGLDALDDDLRKGVRPTVARVHDHEALWLPACETERACLVEVDVGPGEEELPRLHVRSARGLLGHGADVPVHVSGTSLEVRLGVMIGEDLDRATCAEAASALLGYTVFLGWTPASSTHLVAQLGPVLVTTDAVEDVTRLGVGLRVRVQGEAVPVGPPRQVGAFPYGLDELMAYVSRQVPLRAGDVLALGPLATHVLAPQHVGPDVRVEAAIERLGRLAGSPRQAVDPPPWRRTTG